MSFNPPITWRTKQQQQTISISKNKPTNNIFNYSVSISKWKIEAFTILSGCDTYARFGIMPAKKHKIVSTQRSAFWPGLAVFVDRTAKPSLSAVMFADDGIMQNAKLSLRKDPPFGLAILVGRIAKPSLSAVMFADDGIMQAAKVWLIWNLVSLMCLTHHTLAMTVFR